MKRLASLLLALGASVSLAACGNGSGAAITPAAAGHPMTVLHNHRGMHVNVAHLATHRALRAMLAGGNVVADPGFESGAFGTWTQCGNGNAVIDGTTPHTGSYDALTGNIDTTTPEESGMDGVCQTVTVPSGGQLSVWVNEGTSETSTSVADQEADLLDANGNVITTLYSENGNTNGYVEKTFDLSSYAGQSVTLFFGIYGSGSSSDYNYVYVDDVSLTGASGSTPTPQPSATPGATPTPAAAAPCNDQQFLNDQSAFASGSLSGDQLEDVCGQVTQVLPSKTTRSGLHGYFYVAMPDGSQIEIVSNLDAMAQAPTNQPPSTWPWVSVGQYVYVQGRYYYDNSSSQGIDWTEDDTGSWPNVGWVYVCDTSGNNCQKYW